MSTKKVLSTLLAFAIVLSCFGWVPTRAEQADAPALDNTAVAVADENGDYHWYRQNSDGTWSHKRGLDPVKNTDESGASILDPYTADRGAYTYFVGYFTVSPWNNLYNSSASQNTIVQTPAEKAETVIIATSLEMSLYTQNSIHCGGCLSQYAL